MPKIRNHVQSKLNFNENEHFLKLNEVIDETYKEKYIGVSCLRMCYSSAMTTLQDMQQTASKLRLEIEQAKARKSHTEERLIETKAKVESLNSEVNVLDRVTILLNSIGEDRQKEAQEKIEGIVTRGLQTIFGDTYSFHINQKMSGKNAVVEFTVRTVSGDSVIETPVLDSHGGGLAAVIGFLLRVTVMLLDKGTEKANIIVGDEMFAAVSREYLDPLASFVKELVEKTGIQFILITHAPEWSDYADKVYRFGNKKGITYVQEA